MTSANNPTVFNPEDVYIGHFEQEHRDEMLNLILTWANLDVALVVLLSGILDLSLAEGSATIGRYKTSQKFQKIFKKVRALPEGAKTAKMIRKHKKLYEQYSLLRNRIAHSKYMGVLKNDSDVIVFVAFGKHATNSMVADEIRIQEMHQAIDWGDEMTKVILRMAEKVSRDPNN